jgi:RimJ/RimL family protein N-acetyltransferase
VIDPSRTVDGRCWLTTDRLGLRRFTPADLDWLAEFYADAEVVRWVGGTKNRAEVSQMLEVRILKYYDDNPGLGSWMTIERATGTPIGFHLLNNIQGESYIQIGFVLGKPYWAKGFGTEMALALVRYGFVDLGLPQIVGITNLDNHRSQHVLQKVGLRRHGERAFAHPAYSAAGPLAWFERDAADWLAERGPAKNTGDT